ncbi:MAG: pyrroline-5-carboxylate reductase [Proteobacteria bacterium]|nr:MAG: pyrroline-5-carboxylate reductase [Pseudomonadota bacterium]TDJ72697.1 MAG: pyrroline-5-carboxylate reductase [Pseudomonadota bacterium]
MDQAMIGFIGAGNMGRSLAGGLLKSGWDRQRLVLADAVPETRQVVGNLLGLTVYADNNEVADRADVLVLATKPQQMRAVCKGVAPAVQSRKPLIVSIAAGVRIKNIEDWLGGNLPIVRVMPNTPALVNSGASALFANPRASDRQRELAESILRTVGVAIWLSSEDQLDAVTGVSGSGPAYFFLAMEALEQAAVEQGLDAAIARLLAVETAFGAAKMALESGTDPAELRRNVTSPGGTTERAIAKLQDGGFERLFKQAVAAATARSRELADMLGGE